MSGARAKDAMEPLAFSVLAGLTPGHHTITFYDDRLEPAPNAISGDLAAISAGTYSAARAYQLASRYRDQGIKVILGGYHPTFMPEEALEYADSVVIGDAEGAWPRLLEDLEHGSLKRIYGETCYPDISKTYYDETVFTGKKYSKIIPVQYSRGCRYSCEFCSVSAFYGRSIRYRDIDCVTEEIKRKNARFVFFTDDNLFLDRTKTKAFLEAVTPLNIKWVCQISMDIVSDDELLGLMGKAGCICVLIGFETLDSANLKQMGKAANIAYKNYDDVIYKLQHYGLMVFGTFVLGYDNDMPDVFDSCLNFAVRSNMILANFNPLTPMPGTRLYERLQHEGRLLYDKWWLNPEYRYGDAVFLPKGMTPQQLKEGCFRIRSEFNAYSNIFRRYLGSTANRKHLPIFLAANFISRGEIHRKQGRSL
jgi:radical SAM superfamily enzyme YgiQ (UPF0313 family)